MIFPGPYRVPAGDVHATPRCSPTPPGGSPTGDRGRSRPWPARSPSTSPPAGSGSTRPSCGAATCCAATSCRTPTRTACRTTTWPRSRRFEQALAILDYDAFRARAGRGPRRRAATSASASPATPSRRPPAFGYYATEGATIRIEPSGKVNVYVAGGSTGNSLETTVVQLTADALGADIADVAHDPGRHRGHAVRRGHRRQPQRVDDRRAPSGRRRRILRAKLTTLAAHKLEARRGRHRARRAAGRRARRPGRRGHLRRARRHRLLPAVRAAAGHARRARGERQVRADAAPMPVGQRHPRVHLRGRRDDGQR